ncbi:hypothetical protein QTG54_009965 [Skeletonema marinoi]|uniref:PDZ domain-containing protein n=1 Tax=Skeletonema marinoi TaxID=267567 RepID=A0AAD9D9U1_9STRA|nr:hypothetical protein QTG54_009965 [Skeletonema marinoi]
MSFRHNSSLLAARSENNNNNIVTIDLSHHPPNGKLGMLLAPGSLPTPISSDNNTSTTQNAAAALPTASNVTLVAGWEHGNNQQLGPIQRSGMVRLGDRLVRINGRDVTDWTFREVMDVLKEMITTTNQNTATSSDINPKHKRKKKLITLGFAPSGTDEWSRGVIVGGEEFNSSSMLFGLFQSHESNMSPHVISKSKYSFVSFVGRWRVVDESVTNNAAASQTSATRRDVGKGIEQPQQDDDRQQQQQQQQRQTSENSTDLLEEQLNKEPSMKFDGDGPIDIPEHDDEQHDEVIETQQQSPKQAAATTPSIFSSEAEAEWHKEITEFQEKNPPQPKKIVQYEIQCHLLLRDPNSFKSSNNNHTSHHHHGIMNKNNIHHSWSVWKRYSEFQSLDIELRHTFGWQMDATDDGKGIIFPGVHGLESWWYGWRNGGGYLTSLMGGSYGVEVDNGGDDNARVDEETDNGNKKEKRKNADKSSSGMFGLFSNTNATTTETAAATSSTSAHRNHDEDFNNHASISSSSSSTTTTCPYPKPFIEKRQKELTAYWISLSRVEDIFEFSDVNSHRFGTLMASFLEVDQVLLSRRSNSRATAGAGAGTASNQQRYHQPTSPSRLTVPVIHENETELYSFGARKSEQWLSPMTPAREFSGITFNDDDVSMLSDGTGANAYLTNLQKNPSPVPARRLLVDNVPAQFTSNNPLPLTTENRSTAENRSVSSRSSKRVDGRGASRRSKPAFQRQFIME